MGIHDGHRSRLRQRFLKSGLDDFENHQVLELLLFFSRPQGDVNPLAHRLMDRFGSFNAVLDAPVEELVKVSGVGENTAVLLKLVIAANRRYMIARSQNNEILNSTEKAGKFLAPRFYGERDEVVYMVCLDAKYKVLNCKMMFRGSVDTANINIRKVVENALAFNSVSVILAHNHVSGLALPSDEDYTTTRRLIDALSAIDIILADHIVVADDDYVSMADNGFFL